MNIYTHTPYTYRIRWTKTGMSYYGVRYAKGCHPNDLFVTYFTSSKYVSEYIKTNGMPDVVEVRKTFIGHDSIQKAILWESKVLLKIKASTREDYLNKWSRGGVWSHDTVERHKAATTKAMNTDEMKLRCSEHARTCWSSNEYREKYSATRLDEEYNKVLRENIKRGKSSSTKTVRGQKHYRYDSNIYTFCHNTGITDQTTQSEMVTKYKLHQSHLSSLVHGKLKTHKGWRIIK